MAPAPITPTFSMETKPRFPPRAPGRPESVADGPAATALQRWLLQRVAGAGALPARDTPAVGEWAPDSRRRPVHGVRPSGAPARLDALTPVEHQIGSGRLGF